MSDGNNGYEDRARSASPAGRGRSRSPERRPMEEDRREDRGRPDGTKNPGNNLHVSGLSNRVEEHDLEEKFGKFGRIQKIQVMRDPHTGDARGFAFVTMENPEDADAAVAALNATELLGRVMNVQRARRGRARTPTPGAYHGPPKRDTRPGGDRRGGYDDRRGGGYDRYDDRRGGYDDRRGGGGGYHDRGGYDDRRGGYDDRRGGGYDRRDDYRGGGGGYAAPMRDDRGYDDRRY